MAARWKPNVTVAAIVEQAGRFLLVEEIAADGLRLNTPAGHLDAGESPIDACARETLEETAYRFEPTQLIGVYMARTLQPEDTTYLRFAFCGTLGALEAGRALDQGIVRTLWMTIEELRASRDRHRTPLLLQCVEDFLAGQRFPLSLIHLHASVARPGEA